MLQLHVHKPVLFGGGEEFKPNYHEQFNFQNFAEKKKRIHHGRKKHSPKNHCCDDSLNLLLETTVVQMPDTMNLEC